MSLWSRPAGRVRAVLLTVGVLAVSGPVGGAVAVPGAAAASCPPTQLAPTRTAPGPGRTVALTFDDGASQYTPRILAVLRAARVRATFFDTGAHDAAHPDWARQIAAAGQLLANHSWSHPRLAALTGAAQAAEMDRTSTTQSLLTGDTPCFLRPPFGSYDAATLTAAHARHLAVVMWSVDTGDWHQSAQLSTYWTAFIIQQASLGLRQSHPIVLMHARKGSTEPEWRVAAERENTIAALPAIISMYQAAGYRLVDLTGHT